MKERKLYIHVGAGKTGTTAIQEFLYLNREKLDKNGIYIPRVGHVPQKNFIAHHSLSGHGQYQDEDPFPKWEKIATINKDCILVSSENFHSKISRPDGKRFFQRIKDLFKDRRVLIVFYIRKQEQWLQSAYEQWVKSGTLCKTVDPDKFVLEYGSSLCDQIVSFSEVFGEENIIVKPFEKAQFLKNNIFSDFISIFKNIKISDYEFPVRNTNTRLSNDALWYKNIYNGTCDSIKEAQLLTEPLKKYSKTISSSSVNVFHSHSVVSIATQKQIIEQNKEKYKNIAKQFLGRENGELFVEDSELKESNFDAQIDDLARVTSYLIGSLYKEILRLQQENRRLEKAMHELRSK